MQLRKLFKDKYHKLKIEILEERILIHGCNKHKLRKKIMTLIRFHLTLEKQKIIE